MVVDDVTGAPVGRALVTSADGRLAELTDGEGRFRVEGAAGAEGTVVLSARRPGYLTMGRGVELKAGAESVELRLRPEAVVSGVVEAGEERPARGGGGGAAGAPGGGWAGGVGGAGERAGGV